MSKQQKAAQVVPFIRRQPLKIYLSVAAGLFILIYLLVFAFDTPVKFSYSGMNCIARLTLLPGIQKQVNNHDSYTLSHENVTKLGSVPLFSTRDCFMPTSAPEQGVTKIATAPFGGILFKKTYALKVGSQPRANLNILSKPVPTGKPLELRFDAADEVNKYRLKMNDKAVDCNMKETALLCDVNLLALEQGKEYQLTLERSFKDTNPDILVQKSIMTLPATNVTKASVTNGQTVYDKPTAFEVEFDKELASVDAVSLVKKEDNSKVDIESAITGNKLTVTLPKQLDRKSNYELGIDKLEAKDGSMLPAPFVANFLVSGGPRFSGANIGATGASLSQTVVLNFDQPISDTQDLGKFVSIKGVSGTVTKRGNQVLVSYAGAPKCTAFTVSFAAGIESNYGITQSDAQSFSSRTICHTVQTIGSSREGRALQAYSFGNGSRTILFMGAIHGNEKSAKYIMDNWIENLEANAPTIPADKQIVVIPVVNPDGFYKYGRNNAAGVNLNRNWPTSEWATAGGLGGPSPLSEPETQALSRYTSALRPEFIVTYHSKGSIVNSNDVSSSIGLGRKYASMVGYQYVSDPDTISVLGETVTGTYEDWLKARGVPVILIELPSDGGNFFSSNRSAMWMIVNN